MIAKHKVAHVFGGHNHTHRYYHEFGGIPAVTAVNFIAGGNLIVVGKEDFTLAEFCLGCRNPDQHIKRCSLSRMPALLASFPSMPGLADLKLNGASTAVPVGDAKGVQVFLELSPGTAGKAGLRIGSGSKATEIAWTGREIQVAGVPIPFGWEDRDRKALLWSVTLENGRIEFYGNKRYHMSKALRIEQAGR